MKNTILLFGFILAFSQMLPAQIVVVANEWIAAGDGFSWNDPDNWTDGVPNLFHDVLINDASAAPFIDSDVEVASITIENGILYVQDTLTVDQLILSADGFISINEAAVVANQVENTGFFLFDSSLSELIANEIVSNNGTWDVGFGVEANIKSDSGLPNLKGNFNGNNNGVFRIINGIQLNSPDTLNINIEGNDIEISSVDCTGICSSMELSGSGIIENNGNLSYDREVNINGITFINHGILSLIEDVSNSSYGGINVLSGSFTNEVDGIVQFANQDVYLFDGVGSSITNKGTIAVNADGLIDGIINDGNISINLGKVLRLSGDVLHNPGATFSGLGELYLNHPVVLDLTFSGTLAPGNSPGTFQVAGDGSLILNNNSIYEIEIDGPNAGEYDVINATTDITINGTIDLILGYEPIVGHQFEIMVTTGNITSNLPATIQADFGGISYEFSIIENANNIILEVQGSILPIELSYFSANEENEFVRLNWTTFSEINNEYFVIERSENGSDFEEIGRLDGQGNSQTAQHYTFLDTTPKQINYYRLKQVDFDEQFEYSNVEQVIFGVNNDILVYPNPANRGELIHIQGNLNSFALYDLNGRRIKNQTFNLSQLNYDVQTSDLPKGLYILVINESIHQKIIVQ